MLEQIEWTHDCSESSRPDLPAQVEPVLGELDVVVVGQALGRLGRVLVLQVHCRGVALQEQLDLLRADRFLAPLEQITLKVSLLKST